MADLPRDPASDEALVAVLAQGLSCDSRRRVQDSEAAMARVAAMHLVKVLRSAGYLITKGPSSDAPSTMLHMPDVGRTQEG